MPQNVTVFSEQVANDLVGPVKASPGVNYCAYIDSSDEGTHFRRECEVIFDILVSISRYNQDSPSAVQVLFECNLANRGFWPYVFTNCNLCARGQETGGLVACGLRGTHLLMRWHPTSPETSFFWGGALTLLLMYFFL